MITFLQPAAEYLDFLTRFKESCPPDSVPPTFEEFCPILERWEREYPMAWNNGDTKHMRFLEDSLLLSCSDRPVQLTGQCRAKEPAQVPLSVRLIEYVTLFAPHLEARDIDEAHDITNEVWRLVLQGHNADTIEKLFPENPTKVYELALVLEVFRDMYFEVDEAVHELMQRPGSADFLNDLGPQTDACTESPSSLELQALETIQRGT